MANDYSFELPDYSDPNDPIYTGEDFNMLDWTMDNAGDVTGGDPNFWSNITSSLGTAFPKLLAGDTGATSNLGSLLSGAGGTLASLYGSQAQQQAAQNAINAQMAQFATSQKNLAPWLQAGTNALQQMSQPGFAAMPSVDEYRRAISTAGTRLPTYQGVNAPTLQTNANQQGLNVGYGPNLQTNAGQQGINLAGFNYDPNSFFSNPAYQAQMKAGTQAIDASAAAKGNFGSGNQAAALQQLGMQLGAQYQNQDYNQQLGAYGANQQAQLASLGANNQANATNMQLYNQYIQQGYSNQVAAQMANQQANNQANLQNATFSNAANQQNWQNQTSNTQTQYANDINRVMQQYGLDANAATQLYNAQIANQNQLWNRQSSLAGVGQTTANQLGTLGANAASNSGGFGVMGGQAAAQGAQNIASNLGTAGNALIRSL